MIKTIQRGELADTSGVNKLGRIDLCFYLTMSQMSERFKLEMKREKKHNRHVSVSSEYGSFSKRIKHVTIMNGQNWVSGRGEEQLCWLKLVKATNNFQCL
jgi:hypothetical protein